MNLPHWTPPRTGFTAPFWDAIDQDRLELPQCSVCGAWQWYPDDAGTCCSGGVLKWVGVSGQGTVHTFTRVRRPFLPDGAADIPFTVAFVELDDAPEVRFVANVADDDVTIGSRVGIEFVDLGDRRHPVFRKLAA